jgi:uncharacterized protein YdhG (YjbR/CyaY superfamily)
MVEAKPKEGYPFGEAVAKEEIAKESAGYGVTYEEAKRHAKEALERVSWGLKEERLKEFKRHTKFLLIFVVAPLAFIIAAFLIGLLMTAL